VLAEHVRSLAASPFADHAALAPWALVEQLPGLIAALVDRATADHVLHGPGVAVHRSAIVEPGAVLKGPAMIGPRCFVAAGAYVRGGCWLDEDCILGPGAELKTSLMFAGSKLAHFNFVGDSVLGSGVNIEAGAIIANYRNEQDDKEIRLRIDGRIVATGVHKFGALAGDGVRIGANAVVAPGAILAPGRVVPRLSLVDQSPAAGWNPDA
jgi:NDP-sugar pyrophosphorylase family protein